MTRSVPIAIRVAPDELAEIDRRATAKQMSRTDYLICAALGKLNVDTGAVESELKDVKKRLLRLEEIAFSS